jgi:hypothetical protein
MKELMDITFGLNLDYNEVLVYGIFENNIEKVQHAIAMGADMFSIYTLNQEQIEFFIYGDILDILAEASGEIEILAISILVGNDKISSYLIDNATPNELDQILINNETFLRYAIHSNDVDIFEMLLSKLPDVNNLRTGGSLLLDFVILSLTANVEYTLGFMNSLISRNINLNALDEDNDHIAIYSLDQVIHHNEAGVYLEVLSLLVDNGLDITACSDKGNNLLFIVSNYGNQVASESDEEELSTLIQKILAKAPQYINLLEGETLESVFNLNSALNNAIINGFFSLISLLMDNGAEWCIKDPIATDPCF